MKLQKYILPLSLAAAVLVVTGCTNTKDDTPAASATYSDAAVKSIVDYNINNLGEKVVDKNTTSAYNDKNQLVKVTDKVYTYSYNDYLTNDGTAPTGGLEKSEAKSYRLVTEVCNYTPNEDGFATDKVCEDNTVYSVAGKAEQAYANLTNYDKTVLGGLKVLEGKSYKKAYKFKYNDNNYITEQNEIETKYFDNNGTINGNLDTSKTTYEYVTNSDDINDPIAQTIIKEYEDSGSLDSNNSITTEKDGVVELVSTKVYDFSYNEDGLLDIKDSTSASVGPVYKTPAVIPATGRFYVYDGEQLDFVKLANGASSPWGGLINEGKLVYKDGRLNGFTSHVPNYNNDTLNEYKWNDSYLEYIYDGSQVVRVKSAANKKFKEYTYEDFDNELTSFKPLSKYIDNDLDVEGRLVYNGN